MAKTPDNIAVVYKEKRFTYKELDEISDRIAAYIHGKGLHEEDVVSVLIPRCEWMPVISLGVLKAGCAYQPLDPTYPSERLNFMMQDASVKLLIADEELRSIVNENLERLASQAKKKMMIYIKDLTKSSKNTSKR